MESRRYCQDRSKYSLCLVTTMSVSIALSLKLTQCTYKCWISTENALNSLDMEEKVTFILPVKNIYKIKYKDPK